MKNVRRLINLLLLFFSGGGYIKAKSNNYNEGNVGLQASAPKMDFGGQYLNSWNLNSFVDK